MKGHLQKTLEWGAELGVEIAKDLEDKKLSLVEAIALWDNAIGLVGIIKNLKSIPNEWDANKDNEDYMNALVDGVSSKVKGVGTDVARDLVLQGIKAGIEIAKFVQLCVKAHKERVK
jgi:hypothetical protein